nr:1928_t:CDS:2 [Entrophospora candida]
MKQFIIFTILLLVLTVQLTTASVLPASPIEVEKRVINNGFTLCEQNTPITIVDFLYSPDPVKIGQDLIMNLAGKSTVAVVNGTIVDIVATIFGVPVLEKKESFCDNIAKYSPTLTCPIPAGDFNSTITELIPNDNKLKNIPEIFVRKNFNEKPFARGDSIKHLQTLTRSNSNAIFDKTSGDSNGVESNSFIKKPVTAFEKFQAWMINEDDNLTKARSELGMTYTIARSSVLVLHVDAAFILFPNFRRKLTFKLGCDYAEEAKLREKKQGSFKKYLQLQQELPKIMVDGPYSGASEDSFEWFQSLLMAIEEQDIDQFIEIHTYLTGPLRKSEIAIHLLMMMEILRTPSPVSNHQLIFAGQIGIR